MDDFTEKSHSHDDMENDSFDISEWISFFWRTRIFFIKAEIIFLIIGIVTALILPQKFTAVATLLPSQPVSDSARMLSQISSLVGDLSVSGGESLVDLYPDIARSRSVLIDVLNATYENGSFEQALKESFGMEPDEREPLIIKLKDEIVSGSVNRRNKAVTISVTTPHPELSAAFANEILDQMEIFFSNRIKSAATSQRLMIESRLESIADSLKIAEDNLLRFNENNRDISNSPTLRIEEMRLTREVEINNTLYIELTRQLEIAKISELKFKPILNVLEQAVPPIQRSAPQRKKVVLLFLAGGFIVSLGYLKFREVQPRLMEMLKT